MRRSKFYYDLHTHSIFSDGRCSLYENVLAAEALSLLIETGITAIHPLEAKAGNDVRKLKKIYGKSLVFVGNIDVRKMSGTREEIEEEIRSKILVARENGGYLYHSDHSVPPSVSFENYKYVMEMVKKYGEY